MFVVNILSQSSRNNWTTNDIFINTIIVTSCIVSNSTLVIILSFFRLYSITDLGDLINNTFKRTHNHTVD